MPLSQWLERGSTRGKICFLGKLEFKVGVVVSWRRESCDGSDVVWSSLHTRKLSHRACRLVVDPGRLHKPP
jgi:hypothetical protein